MGNFSRNTFDPTKNYVAVRLQQGVPLVDADWNELQDVTRDEVYAGLRAAQQDVAQRGGLDVTVAGANDIQVSPGIAVAGGRPVQVWTPLRYTTQRYADPAVAAADGVAPVLPMPLTPAPLFLLRTDNVYLDVFEREVASAEDATLVNPRVGIETAVRRRREVVLRVEQGGPVPAPAPNHVHFPVAQLQRRLGPLIQDQVIDVKPYPLPLGPRELAFAPWLQPVTGTSVTGSWVLTQSFGAPPKLTANKPAGVDVTGVMPLDLPDGARLTQLRTRGSIAAAGTSIFVKLVRSRHDFSGAVSVAEDTVSAAGAFDRVTNTVPAESVVDNTLNHYFLHVIGAIGGTAEIRGGAVLYVP